MGVKNVYVFKLRCGDWIIAKIVKEDNETITLEKPLMIAGNVVLPWLYPVQNPPDQVTIYRGDLLLPPMMPQDSLYKTYIKKSSGIEIAEGHPNVPPSYPPGYGGPGVPPTRGGTGGVPPTRGGLG